MRRGVFIAVRGVRSVPRSGAWLGEGAWPRGTSHSTRSRFRFNRFLFHARFRWGGHGRVPQRSGRGCCVGRTPNRRFRARRCREYLSSGEKRAGCAERVGCPAGDTFLRV